MNNNESNIFCEVRECLRDIVNNRNLGYPCLATPEALSEAEDVLRKSLPLYNKVLGEKKEK